MSEIEEEKKPKRNIMDYVSLVDFFSTETSFGFEGEDSFKTMCGGAISLLIMVICLIVTVTDPTYYSNSIYLTEVLDENPYTVNNKLFNMGVTLLNATGNFTIPISSTNWTVTFSCDEYNLDGTAKSKTSFPSTSRNCAFGDHCIPDQFTCNLYRKSTGEFAGLAVNMFTCDGTSPGCNLTALDTDFGITATSNYKLILNVSRLRPNPDSPGWTTSVSSFNMEFSINYAQIIGLATMRREEFSSADKFQGALGLPLTTYVRYNPIDRYPNAPSYGMLTPTTSNLSVLYYLYQPDIRINQYQQQFTNLSGMLSNYFAISGVILVFYSIFFSHYSENMLNMSLGQHLHYITGPDKRPINFSETNIKSIITCMVYFRSMACMYPKCLASQIAMIEAGRSKLNLNKMLEDLISINAQDSGKNPIIKLRIEEEEDEEESEPQKPEQVEASVADFMRTNISESIISIREIEIFVEWVKLNHYTVEESKEVARRLFLKRNSTDNVFAENEAREYQAFKDSMKDCDYDELHLVSSGHPDSDTSLNKLEKEKEKNVELVFERAKEKEIKIKGDKEVAMADGLQIMEDPIEPKTRERKPSVKEMSKLVISVTNPLAESGMRVVEDLDSPETRI